MVLKKFCRSLEEGVTVSAWRKGEGFITGNILADFKGGSAEENKAVWRVLKRHILETKWGFHAGFL